MTFGAFGDIQIGLVQRKGLNLISLTIKDLADLLGGLSVLGHGTRDNYQIGAEFEGLARRHGRAHTELSRLVVTSGNYAAAVRFATYGNGQINKAGIVAHFHCGVETVAVAVDNLSHS